MNEYNFRIYNNRRKSEITYKIRKTEAGWSFQYIAINGECQPDGKPLFDRNFDQDFICYPSDFHALLEFIWLGLHKNEISSSDAAHKLQELADWVSTCERSKPKWNGFSV